VQRDALGQALANGHAFASAAASFAAFILLVAAPYAARSDWAVGADARVRHDNNVGNAQLSSDIVADSIVDARLSAYRLFPFGDGYGLTVGGDLSGEVYHEIKGLNNASLDASFALRKKWGLGALVPWVRVGAAVARSNYRDSYRDSWDYRATLASGRRIAERWNLWGEFTWENRAASAGPEEVPGWSSDAFSQISRSVAANLEYSLSQSVFLSLGLSGRRGDVVSTTLGPNAMAYYASAAIAADPAFGPNAYAYRLTGTTRGAQVGINYSATTHSLLGAGFERFDTHADGGNNYTKSIVQITWNYDF
jgi:hypothetical protein